MGRLLGVVAGSVVLALSPAPARADSITKAGSTLTYTGMPSSPSVPFIDVNTLSGVIEFDAGSVNTISPIPAQCDPVGGSGRFVDCDPAGIARIVVELGSANDFVLAPFVPLPLTVNGGDGSDDITGGTAPDVINGEGGGDELAGDGVFGGASSHDDIDGGAGDDVLVGGVGRDDLHGGPGLDRADYASRTAGVTVTLDGVADDGAPGESDNVFADVENLRGGSGDDVLSGSDAANELVGNAGGDVLIGGGGVDTFAGGPGADTLRARDGLAESANCGDDADAAEVDLSDVASNCEAVSASGVLQVDADGDGVDDPVDCDDLDAAIRPGILDVPDNGVDEDCSGADAENLDRDGDGSFRPADCDDANPAIRPGVPDIRGNAVDEDCKGGPAPFRRVKAEIANVWRVFADRTEVARLRVRPSGGGGAKLVVRCRGRGCPYPRRAFALRRKPVDLGRAFRRRSLRPGATIEVRVTRARMIGKVVRYRIRDEQAPKATALCLPPGASKPEGC